MAAPLALARFNITRFTREWENLFDTVINKTLKTFTIS